ncbi:hypothetical protein ACFPM0_16565 [Pseudonocardia sulfidoxydans]|uniref:hypothetical protein n=1 Tax=Pseudonocardia sulfidoxydans TaxID=54011 RepID=UPI003616C718
MAGGLHRHGLRRGLIPVRESRPGPERSRRYRTRRAMLDPGLPTHRIRHRWPPGPVTPVPGSTHHAASGHPAHPFV